MNTKLEKVLSDLESASEELKNSVKKTRIESRRLQEAPGRCNKKASYHKVAITSNQVADILTPAKDDQSIGKSDSGLKLKTGATPGANGVRLASELFTEDELQEGIISPQKASTRTPLDSEKSTLSKAILRAVSAINGRKPERQSIKKVETWKICQLRLTTPEIMTNNWT